MSYWNAVLSSPFNNLKLGQSAEAVGRNKPKAKQKPIRSRVMKVYYLDPADKSLYLTHREAECVVRLVKGLTIRDIAEALTLSARTVEFYLKNIKKKLAVRTKSQLIQKIYASQFMRENDL